MEFCRKVFYNLDFIYHCEYSKKVPGIDLIFGVDPLNNSLCIT